MYEFILLLIAIAISAFITPFVRKFAIKINAIDVPKESRRIHKKPIPLLGGIAIYISFLTVVMLKRGALTYYEIGILLGASVIVIGGFLDDKYNLKPYQKLLFQIAAGIILICFDVKISLITNPFSNSIPYLNLEYICYPITLLWVVGITNAFNFIDGLDGLAAGVAFISSVTICIIAFMNNRYEAALMTLILSGAILGFLPYNFNPASIFMGDTGSQLLGFLLAAISMKGTIKSATAFAIAVPVLTFGIPIYDTAFAVIRRKINGKPISQADRGHIHHRLLDMGLTQRQAVLIMYLISIILSLISILAMQISSQRSYFLVTSVIIIIVIVAWKFGMFKHNN